MDNADFAKKLFTDLSWVLAGLNYDEDLHFSSFYIRNASTNYNEIGYNTIVAYYKNFNESYFVPSQQCTDLAQTILNKMIQDPQWMLNILESIYMRINYLDQVFSKFDIEEDFSKFQDSDILKLYRRHNKEHCSLYRIALVVEALDRGFNLFTNYLYNLVKEKCDPLEIEKATRFFNILITPSEASIFQKASFQFSEIIKDILQDKNIFKQFLENFDRIRFYINPSLQQKIEDYRKKWGFVEYHGYGTRRLPNIEEYLRRLRDILIRKAVLLNESTFNEKLVELAREKKKCIESLRIDSDHQILFNIYPKIGLCKLYRRFIQLKNFYFLDKLLEDIARRRGICEGLVRNLLPEEIERLLQNQLEILPKHWERLNSCALIISKNKEFILYGENAEIIYSIVIQSLLSKSNKINDPSELSGIPVSLGTARGTCRIIKRKEDAIKSGFKQGNILISEATDPDLIEIIKMAGGVATQQGGVTSHAAIICRENNIPSIIGVDNLLDLIKDGDEAFLDANRGKIKIEKHIDKKWEYVIFPNQEKELKTVGNKFFSLNKIIDRFNIPRFFGIDSSKLITILNSTEDIRNFNREVEDACTFLNADLVAIRSSFCIEDCLQESKAGYFPTFLSIKKEELIREIMRFIEKLNALLNYIPKGSIIVQEMIEGDLSGICFTADPVTLNRDHLILEIVAGQNWKLTDGRIKPQLSLKVNKNDYDIIKENKDSKYSINLSWQKIIEILSICKDIENIFTTPQDIEWTYKNNKFYILQTRPITNL